MPRSIHFEDPITLPGGRTLKTLADARAHMASLPKATQRSPEWQHAANQLSKAEAKTIPTMIARSAVYRAIYPELEHAPRVRRASKDELFKERRRAFVAKRDAATNAKKPRPTR